MQVSNSKKPLKMNIIFIEMGVYKLFSAIKNKYALLEQYSTNAKKIIEEKSTDVYIDMMYLIIQFYDKKRIELNESKSLTDVLVYIMIEIRLLIESLKEKYKNIIIFVDYHMFQDIPDYKLDDNLFHEYLPIPTDFPMSEIQEHSPAIHYTHHINIVDGKFNKCNIRLKNEIFDRKNTIPKESNFTLMDYRSLCLLKTSEEYKNNERYREKIDEIADHAWYRFLITRGARIDKSIKRNKDYDKEDSENSRLYLKAIVYSLPLIIHAMQVNEEMNFYGCLLEGESALVKHIRDHDVQYPTIYTSDTDLVLMLGDLDCMIHLYNSIEKQTYYIHPPTFWYNFFGASLDLRVIKMICVLRGTNFNEDIFNRIKSHRRRYEFVDVNGYNRNGFDVDGFDRYGCHIHDKHTHDRPIEKFNRCGFANVDGTGEKGDYHLKIYNYHEIKTIMNVNHYSDIKFEDLKLMLLNSVKLNNNTFNRKVLLACNMYLQNMETYFKIDITMDQTQFILKTVASKADHIIDVKPITEEIDGTKVDNLQFKLKIINDCPN